MRCSWDGCGEEKEGERQRAGQEEDAVQTGPSRRGRFLQLHVREEDRSASLT